MFWLFYINFKVSLFSFTTHVWEFYKLMFLDNKCEEWLSFVSNQGIVNQDHKEIPLEHIDKNSEV